MTGKTEKGFRDSGRVKLICLDIDGTLLNSEHRITQGTRDAVRTALESGIRVTLVTGRMFGGAVPVARELGLKDPIVALNGALIKDPATDRKLRSLVIERESVDRIITILEEEGVRPNFYSEYILYIADRLDRYERMVSRAGDPRYRIRILDSGFTYQDMLDEAGDQLQKGILFPGAQLRPELAQKLRTVPGISVVSSSYENIEITRKGADKGSAILELAGSLNIQAGEILAIGDSENDRSMLEAAGWSVAMGNAGPELKSVARFTTFDNDHDGAAMAIRRHALGGIC